MQSNWVKEGDMLLRRQYMIVEIQVLYNTQEFRVKVILYNGKTHVLSFFLCKLNILTRILSVFT